MIETFLPVERTLTAPNRTGSSVSHGVDQEAVWARQNMDSSSLCGGFYRKEEARIGGEAPPMSYSVSSFLFSLSAPPLIVVWATFLPFFFFFNFCFESGLHSKNSHSPPTRLDSSSLPTSSGENGTWKCAGSGKIGEQPNGRDMFSKVKIKARPWQFCSLNKSRNAKLSSTDSLNASLK